MSSDTAKKRVYWQGGDLILSIYNDPMGAWIERTIRSAFRNGPSRDSLEAEVRALYQIAEGITPSVMKKLEDIAQDHWAPEIRDGAKQLLASLKADPNPGGETQ
mgnify:FL=1